MSESINNNTQGIKIDQISEILESFYEKEMCPLSPKVKAYKNAVTWWVKGTIQQYKTFIPTDKNGNIIDLRGISEALHEIIAEEKKIVVPFINIGFDVEVFDKFMEYLKENTENLSK